MQGYFDLTKYDVSGLCDQDILQAQESRKLDALLQNRKKTAQMSFSNRLFDNLAGYLLDHVFQGPQAANPYSLSPGISSALASIALLTTDAETTSYTEHVFSVTTPHGVSETANGLTAGKRFIADQMETFQIVASPNADGREEIQFTNKWMYLPSEGVSTDIRSIGIYFGSDGDNLAVLERARLGRVRIKDAQGEPVILHKSDQEILIVQYSYRLLSN